MSADAPAPRPQRKRWWQHAWAVFGAVVAVVGAITGVIGIMPFLLRDATDAESLVVSVQPADSDLVPVFAVPLDADWAAFPAAEGGCSTEQRAWLKSVGTVLPERYLVSVTNTAAEGATLSLRDFRGEGDAASAPASSVAVACDTSGAGTSAMRAALIDPASGRTAVYAQADPSLPDNPLVFNLAPGESGEFALLVQSSADFEGSIVFTSAIGQQATSTPLPIEGGVVAPGLATQRFVVSADGLACVGDEACDPLGVIETLRAAR